MSKKKYDGYRSYAYLKEGEDYQAIRDSGPSYTQVRCVDGMENPGEAMRNAVRWLVKHGYTDADIAKLAGGNALRVLNETWAR